MPIPFSRIQTSDEKFNRLQDRIAAAIQQFVNPLTWANIGDPGAPVFQNGWARYAASSTPLNTDVSPTSFAKDAQGIVRLRGASKGGTVGTVGFTLPAGYRPAFRMTFITIGDTATRTDVFANGDV